MANELAAAQVAPQAPQIPSPLAEVAQGIQPAAILPPVSPNAPMDEAQDFVVSNFETLPQIGLDIFEAPDLTTVVFNSKLLDKNAVAAAVESGTLQELLTPRPQPGQELAGAAASVAQSRAAERPQMEVQSAPAAPALPAPKVPASTQTSLARARVRNLGGAPKPPGITPDPISSRVSKRPV